MSNGCSMEHKYLHIYIKQNLQVNASFEAFIPDGKAKAIKMCPILNVFSQFYNISKSPVMTEWLIRSGFVWHLIHFFPPWSCHWWRPDTAFSYILNPSPIWMSLSLPLTGILFHPINNFPDTSNETSYLKVNLLEAFFLPPCLLNFLQL